MPRFPVQLPQFGESAAEATVVSWLVKPGEAVKADQDLVEVQTEKAVMTVTAPHPGVLEEQCVHADHKIAVGGILCYLTVAEGIAVPAHAAHAAAALHAHAAPASASPNGRSGFSAELPPPSAPGSERLSPRVLSRMAEANLSPADLAGIPGTGMGGRVTARDVEQFLASTEGTTISPLRFSVAASMARSWSRPLATIARNVRMDALLEHRREIPGRPSANTYAMRALAIALSENDRLACKLIGNRLIRPNSIDLAFAVAIEDGVLTPVVKHVDKLGLEKLAETCQQITAKARERGLTDATGTSVGAVSNYGTLGITWATPIPLPGHGLILGIGAMKNAPDWNSTTKAWDRIRQAELTLTFDHRLADGGGAAKVMHRIAELMENPGKL